MQCKDIIDKIILRQLKRNRIFSETLLNTFTEEELHFIFPPYEEDLSKYKEEVDEIYNAVKRENIRSIKTIMIGCRLMFPHKISGTYFSVDNWSIELDSNEDTNDVTIIKYSDDYESPSGSIEITKEEFLELVAKLYR